MTRVLLVDDEPMLLEELQEALELDDFNVVTAESVCRAEEIFEREIFDVVVTDLKMPKRGGLELIASLKPKRPDTLFFVVSGHGAKTNRETAESLGATDCFDKPLDVDKLVDAINERM